MPQRTSRESPDAVALFDFDYTLIRRDSFASLVRELLGRDWWRITAAAGLLPAIVPLLSMPRTRGIPVQTLIWLATLGLDGERLARHIQTHVAELVRDPTRLVHRDGLARVREHQEAGHRVVIATGALEDLARAICGGLGLADIEIVGSSLRPWGGGMRALEHCFGERKVTMLRARGFPPPWRFVYTDSASDLPLLRHAEEGFFVNPTRRALQRARRALPSPPVVLRWA
jgi:phosphatidylglycerophosphatase C